MRSNAPTIWALHEGEIHLWYANVDHLIEKFHVRNFDQFLSADELERVSRFRFNRDRKLFLAAHGLMRVILSNYLNVKPSELSFSIGPFGRPELAGSSSRLRFNLSHSGKAVLLGVTLQAAIGVDIALVQSAEKLLDVARQSFTPRETEWIAGVAADEKIDRFFTIWTLKEAYVKARGFGLNLPLASFDIIAAADGSARLGREEPLHPHHQRWIFRHFRILNEYRAAVAVRSIQSTPPRLTLREMHEITAITSDPRLPTIPCI
jgi:4'-phosphopantetheinyl transferase